MADSKVEKKGPKAAPGPGRLASGFSGMSVWAFSIGTSIGWGSLMVTCNTYLAQAGVLGTVLGLFLGMLVILVITQNLQFMICRHQDAGGIYTYAQKVCGRDFGFLAAWFLLLTYMSVLWANITSVPLFMRFFTGELFRFGFSYNIFGYEVYLGEALLCIAAVMLVGLICSQLRRAIHWVMIAAAVIFVAGFAVCGIWALLDHTESSFSFEPLFLSDTSSVAQTARIAVISPWAFIGFENIAHFSEEYSFKVSKIRRILYTSVIMTTALYVIVTLLSVTAYPPEYSSWLEYISDMGNLTGFKAVPAFYAMQHYLGEGGVAVLLAALFGAIITSLIGNTMALSRLLFSAGRDGSAPAWLGRCNSRNNPANAIYAIVAISVLIPFLGRTAIGWIVDVTTLGATIIYGLASFAVFTDARRQKLAREQTTGMMGFILMLVFVLMLLLPNLFSFSAMESESYILFVLWAVLGLIYFRRLVFRGAEREYGHSVLVWVVLLLLVLFASMMWVSKETQSVTHSTFSEIQEHYQTEDESGDMEYLEGQSRRIQSSNAMYTVASFAVFIFFATIILSNYRIMRRRDDEHSKELSRAEIRATTDQLTGIKNRRAYAYTESRLDERIAASEAEPFAIVVCDINDLKKVNDADGHNAGDRCIRMSCDIICGVFEHSPVFRIGGDEFAVILEHGDYERRHELVEELNRASESNKAKTGSTLAVGISEYNRGEDESVLDVFSRADRLMYQRKTEMKKSRPAR